MDRKTSDTGILMDFSFALAPEENFTEINLFGKEFMKRSIFFANSPMAIVSGLA